jgi:hypothetical protein
MDQQFEVEKEKMDVTDLYETLIKQTENIYGTYNDLYGNITVNGTNKLLQNMKTLNLFGNRVSTTETGFIEGDLVYIPYGLYSLSSSQYALLHLGHNTGYDFFLGIHS